ncbi:MAG: SDR family NAD(P)-dependent oxidoreductase [Thermoplasmata archaeon]
MAVTELLSSGGHEVFATARKAADLTGLGRLPHVTPIRLDITKADEVERTSEWIRTAGKGLYGLVNNAGIGGFGPMVDTPVEDLHRVLDSNLYGMHRMVRACFPFLLKSHGRIVNICSIAGILTEPFRGTYGVSKHAAESYSDILREEFSGLGIRVSAIEPGSFRSNIISSVIAHVGPDPAAAWKDSVYHEAVQRAIAQLTSTPERIAGLQFPEPRPVAEAVSDALFSEEPKPRYLVANSEETDRVIAQVLTLLKQLNQKNEHSLTTAQLTERFEANLK